MNDPHDHMMPPRPQQFDEKDIWDEKPGMLESYWDILLWPPLWIMLLGVTTIGASIWAIAKYL